VTGCADDELPRPRAGHRPGLAFGGRRRARQDQSNLHQAIADQLLSADQVIVPTWPTSDQQGQLPAATPDE
jgi:hypothetical protein